MTNIKAIDNFINDPIPLNMDCLIALGKSDKYSDYEIAYLATKLGKSVGITGRIINAITGKVISDTELEIENEFIQVFNGISLQISEEEVRKIKEIKGIKKVYPNYKVNITLSDSVPLINVDDVWLLDEDGNSCVVSGNDCLTGKGVTIGIIDTGVDYTHPDFGGCFGQGCKVSGGYDFVNNDNDPMDDHGHGTHVAATAAGNGILKGVAPDAKIYAYKVLELGTLAHL